MRRITALLLLASALVAFSVAHTASNDAHSKSHSTDSDILSPRIAKIEHKCVHDEMQALKVPVKRVDQSWQRSEGADGQTGKRAPNWMPFRVTIALDNLQGDSMTCYSAGTQVPSDSGPNYQCTANDVMTAEKLSYLNNSMLAVAAARLGQLLQVDRTGPISASSSSCGSVSMPSRFTPTADTDFILLVTTRPIPSDGGSLRTLAYATTCQTAADDDRPIVGWANFDPSALDPSDDSKLALQVGVAIHEISHALGFNGGSFVDRGLATDGRVTHPDVVSYVRNHFGCDTAIGALLEDNDGGGGGTAGSHWEKSAFMNEYMTGTASNNPVISPLTLITFQATGWYQADLTQADSLVFGRATGCGMISDWSGCTAWPESYKCTSTSVASKCSADRAGYGSCVTEPSGGLIGNGCSYYSSDTTCIFPFPPDSAQAKARNGNSKFQTSGQTFAQDSRCFDSTLNKISSLSDIVAVPAPSGPKCHRVKCSAINEPRVNIAGTWYPCSPGGTKITATGFGGSVTCPQNAYLDLCQYQPYDETWPRITSINPNKAKPGAEVKVGYTGAPGDDNVKIIIETDTTDSKITDNSTLITAKLAGDDYWGSPKYLNLFNTKLNVIIKDSQGRTDVRYNAFQADIGFGLAYFKALFGWMKKNVLFTVLICIAIAIPCIITCFCCYKKCCKKKKKKPQRMEYQHSYDREADEYYYDEELEDRTRHAPPAPIRY